MRKHIYAAVAVLLLFVGAGERTANAQQLAIETDAVMLGALTPNLGIELVTGERTSLSLTAAGNYHPYGLDFRGFGARPEFKLWLSGRPMVQEYLGLACVLAGYGMTFDGKVHEGSTYGLGITGGWSFKLSDHFCLELSGGMGAMYYTQRLYSKGEKYEDYFPGDQAVRNNSDGYFLAPMKLSATLVWIIR